MFYFLLFLFLTVSFSNFTNNNDVIFGDYLKIYLNEIKASDILNYFIEYKNNLTSTHNFETTSKNKDLTSK